MIEEFHDENGQRLHAAFQKWRQTNLNGFFLTFKARNRALLHSSQCHHPGDIKWDGYEPGKNLQISLTRHRKVCFGSQSELLSWAEINGVTFKPCSHCIHGPLAKLRYARIEYVEKQPSKENFGKIGVTRAKTEIGKILEGIYIDVTVKRRSRSARLRREAVDSSNGICEACQRDFSRLLDGLGYRVLQAHHRKQIALSEEPILNGIEDIAVLCANCHVLIHADVTRALEVDELRRMLRFRKK